MLVKKFIGICVTLVCGYLHAQTSCCSGYEEGYRRGYTYPNMNMAGIVYVPACGCYRIIGNPSYNDGFALGYADGQRQKAEENNRQEENQNNSPQHQRFVYPDYVPGSAPPAEWQQARMEADWEAFTGALLYCAKFFSEFQLSLTRFTNLSDFHPSPIPPTFINPNAVEKFNSVSFVAKHNMKDHFRLEVGYFNALSFGESGNKLYKNQFAKFQIATFGINYNFRKYRSYKFMSPYVGAEIFRRSVTEAGISSVVGSEFRLGYNFSIDLRHKWSQSVFNNNRGGTYTYIPNVSLGLIYKVK